MAHISNRSGRLRKLFVTLAGSEPLLNLREPPLKMDFLGTDIFTEPSLEEPNYQGWLC